MFNRRNMKNLVKLSALIVTGALLFTGCGGERVATDGDTVSVHYTGTLENGAQFDSSRGKEPLTFVIGAGEMIAGFDSAVRGMKVGEIKTVTLQPEEAYGPQRPDLIFTLSRDQIPEDMTVTIGQRLPMQSESGQQFVVTVIELGEDTLTVDANHPLAGKVLIFEIELMSITPEEN